MRIFATDRFINNLKESSPKTHLYGVDVATNDFYKNLIRFGRFDEYNFLFLQRITKSILCIKN